jgi:hypothetical protein
MIFNAPEFLVRTMRPAIPGAALGYKHIESTKDAHFLGASKAQGLGQLGTELVLRRHDAQSIERIEGGLHGVGISVNF